MSITIPYYANLVYHREVYHLSNHTQASLWFAATRRTTITGPQMEALHELTGVTFTRVDKSEAAHGGTK